MLSVFDCSCNKKFLEFCEIQNLTNFAVQTWAKFYNNLLINFVLAINPFIGGLTLRPTKGFRPSRFLQFTGVKSRKEQECV
jgi:hypothetical protein